MAGHGTGLLLLSPLYSPLVVGHKAREKSFCAALFTCLFIKMGHLIAPTRQLQLVMVSYRQFVSYPKHATEELQLIENSLEVLVATHAMRCLKSVLIKLNRENDVPRNSPSCQVIPSQPNVLGCFHSTHDCCVTLANALTKKSTGPGLT